MSREKTELNGMEDGQLSALLKNAKPKKDLPPGFEGAVWRRIVSLEDASHSSALMSWLDQIIDLFLQPRFALIGLSALFLIGGAWGTLDGTALSKENAKMRYLVSVSPSEIHP